MPNSLDTMMSQTLLLIKDGLSTRKMPLSTRWQTTTAITDEEMIIAVQRARDNDQRIVLIISEEEFEHCLHLLRKRILAEYYPRFGALVISTDPMKLLGTHSAAPELLDVVADKEWKKGFEIPLYRAMRQLLRNEAHGNPKLGQKTLELLNEICIALSAERNPQRLLATILLKAIDLTQAKGGALHMIQEHDGELYFRLRITDDRSGEVDFQHMNVRAVENSLCGYVALTGKILNIPDVAELKPLTLPQFNKAFDHADDDKTVSILTLPLKNTRNEIIAVLQLVNKTSEGGVGYVAFDSADESLLSSFATQAAICIENVDLYGDIQRLFDGFVKASISAIESRDPSTGGHSERVAKMSVALARATTECEVGIYRSVKFREEEVRELEYAALLHDFGKIGVREEVLVKAKKLHPYQLEGIKDRIKICKAAAKIAYLERRLTQGVQDVAHEREYQQRLREIDSVLGDNHGRE